MHRLIVTMAAALFAAIVLAAPAAGADRSDCPRGLERSYSKSYTKVVKLHGKRAPGRHIRANGVLFRGVVFDATCGELRRSLRQLKRLATPAPYAPLLVKDSGAPAQPPAGVQTPSVGAGSGLRSIAQCESGGNYATNTGNGFYGAYQFDMQTWQSVGGSGNPAAASPAEQDKRAAILYSQRGASPWPVCGR